ncbi:prolyl oligopeptidase family serine peptidase [Sphaerisporangium sp. B11E5]|uniref:prolyl oligopeptidase family serine peptidase n=1 Tax=Sphaerisporangium sp. B11E5 TaxID=3153563 RepID=UPI00325C705B
MNKHTHPPAHEHPHPPTPVDAHPPTPVDATRVDGHPPARRAGTAEVRHGRRVADPYRWLEDATAPETTEWSRRQRALTTMHMDSLPSRATWAKRLTELGRTKTRSIPVHRGDQEFYLAQTGNGPALHTRAPSGTEHLVYDPAPLGPEGRLSVDAWTISPTARLLALQTSLDGTETGVLHIVDLTTGTQITPPIQGVRHPTIAWLPDDSAFYYTKGPHVRLHTLGAGEDTPVFTPANDPTTTHRIRLDHNRWLVVSTRTGTTPANHIHLADLTRTPTFTKIPLPPGTRTQAHVSRQGTLYLHTTAGAPRGRVLTLPAGTPGAPKTEVLPEDPTGAVLTAIALLDDDGTRPPRLLTAHTRHSTAELTVRDATTGRKLSTVPLPGAGTVRNLTTSPDAPSTAWFTYTDHLTPPTILRHDSTESPPRHRPHDISSWQETYTSKDGTLIRMFLLARAGPKGPRPTLLTAYGGFGISMTPTYDPNVHAWVERGGVFAVACVRGGGDEGEHWHRAGMRHNKPTTFDDLHAAATHLITTGRTTRTHLGLVGASNAGLLAAVAITQRPDLYRAAVLMSPLTDMARYELSGMGRGWRAEYGTADDPADLDVLLSYSPYHNVRPGTAYPACLIVAFTGDTRVDPLHARKLTAALQHATTGHPVLLQTHDHLGHGPRPTSAATTVGADTLSFLAHELGLP